ncbi:UNVERIFIED_CONTAM: Outer envelope pore protein 24, chloroplastic [Sesamum latifolium]|uniref:Outer envelope pore protein 24, chloroplastic n=1 Tax=Sesamum latifolium TaxID=2727402 RepID=A0AAW2W9P2_9LAMI
MMKASFKARYEPDKAAAAATVSVNAGDLKLRASITDATVVNGPSLNGLSLAVERPGFFIVDYNVPKKDFRFQFMNTVRVAEKSLNLSYTHLKGDARTILDGTLVIDSANKVSVNHVLDTGNTKLKYSYLHGGLTTFEPSYDLGKNTWDFAVSRRVYGDDVFRATYQTSSKNLGLEWSRSSKLNGSFKILASVNLADERKCPNYVLKRPGTLKCNLLSSSAAVVSIW